MDIVGETISMALAVLDSRCFLAQKGHSATSQVVPLPPELKRVLSDVLAACGRLRESTEVMECLR